MKQSFTDKEILQDMLVSQKSETAVYNLSANESSNPSIRGDFMKILSEEHSMQSDVFEEMHKRGWYKTPEAEQKKIDEVINKFKNQ